jgi:hypothetical protein
MAFQLYMADSDVHHKASPGASILSGQVGLAMDDSLFNDNIERIVLPLYPNIPRTASFDAKTVKSAHNLVCCCSCCQLQLF